MAAKKTKKKAVTKKTKVAKKASKKAKVVSRATPKEREKHCKFVYSLVKKRPNKITTPEIIEKMQKRFTDMSEGVVRAIVSKMVKQDNLEEIRGDYEKSPIRYACGRAVA